MQDDGNGGSPIAFRTAMPPFPADYTGEKIHNTFGFLDGLFCWKSQHWPFWVFFYLLLLFLKVGFNDLTPGIRFAPDLSQGDVLYFIPHCPLGSVLL